MACLLEDGEGLAALRVTLAVRMRQHYQEWVQRPLAPSAHEFPQEFQEVGHRAAWFWYA